VYALGEFGAEGRPDDGEAILRKRLPNLAKTAARNATDQFGSVIFVALLSSKVKGPGHQRLQRRVHFLTEAWVQGARNDRLGDSGVRRVWSLDPYFGRYSTVARPLILV
jgi:hypothetical protein